MTCEEIGDGQVYECDPYTPGNGVLRAALGSFQHEAAAVDPIGEAIYLTEDRATGKLYRFRPTVYPDLSAGTLEVAQVAGGSIAVGEVKTLSWTTNVSLGFEFDGGEGCWYDAAGLIYFSTKGDHRVWRIDTSATPHTLEIFYDGDGALTEPDNVHVTPTGDVYVAEDAGNLEIVALTMSGGVHPIVRLTGKTGIEIAGPALNTTGDRLYFSKQHSPGTTYEITGPFLGAPASVPASRVLAQGIVGGVLTAVALSRLRARRVADRSTEAGA